MASPWVGDRVYDVLGTPFRIRSDEQAIAERVAELLAPFRTPEEVGVPPENVYNLLARVEDGSTTARGLRRGAEMVFSTPGWPRLLDRMMSEINQTALEGFDDLASHAGVVALGERAIAFPASSGGGKSTLAAACVQAGFQYVSDEALCLDLATRRVVPYPKPCALSPKSRDLLGIERGDPTFVSEDREALFTAEDLGGRTASGDLVLHNVVLAERGDGRVGLDPLTSAEVVAGVLKYSFNHYKHPEESFRVMVDIARHCRGWRLTYREPLQAVSLLREALS
jgi:hypothetical protein